MERHEPEFQVAVFRALLAQAPLPQPAETPQLAANSTTTNGTSIHNLTPLPLELPHQTVLAKIEKNNKGTISRTPLELDNECLEAYSNTLSIYWSISAVVLAVYMISKTKLVIYDKGVFQMNEAEDHLRYRGRNKKMEHGAWKLSIGLEDATLEEARGFDEDPIDSLFLTLIEGEG